MRLSSLILGKNVTNYDDELFAAVQSLDLNKPHVEALLAQGANINAQDALGSTPLCRVLSRDFDGNEQEIKAIVEFLLAKGAEVNPKKDERWPYFNKEEKADWLAQFKKINNIYTNEDAYEGLIELRSNRVTTPLHLAAFARHHETVELLITHGADVNTRDSQGKTPLHISAHKQYDLIAKPIIAQKADVNAKDLDGNTPLHVAALHQSKAVVELLIKSGADIDARNRRGETPFHIAARHKIKEVADLLLAHGASQ